jgi:hypothetical protein
MPEASRLLATACALKRVWLMPSARTDEPHEEVVERAGTVPLMNGTEL